MATTRNRRAKASPPVEVKPVEAPQAEEVKEAPKPVEKKVEAPKVKEVKENPASMSSSNRSELLPKKGSVITDNEGKEWVFCRASRKNRIVVSDVSTNVEVVLEKELFNL